MSSPDARPEPSQRALLEELERLRTENEHLLESQRALEESRDHYSDLFDHAPVAWLTLDAHGTVTTLNLIAITLLGFGRRHAIGTPLANLVHPDDRRKLLEHLSACRRRGELQACEVHLPGRDAEAIPVRLATRANRVGEGHTVACGNAWQTPSAKRAPPTKPRTNSLPCSATSCARR
ncbi:MAG: PAS domain-containing protein [Polyangiaceae bacterium]